MEKIKSEKAGENWAELPLGLRDSGKILGESQAELQHAVGPGYAHANVLGCSSSRMIVWFSAREVILSQCRITFNLKNN